MSIRIRHVEISDAKRLFEWANDYLVRNNSFSVNKIEWDEHYSWFKKKLKDSNCRFYIFSTEHDFIGQARFDFKDSFWIIDFSVDPKYHNKGFGTQIICMALRQFEPKNQFKAYAKHKNLASNRIFEKLGFLPSEIICRNGEKINIWVLNS